MVLASGCKKLVQIHILETMELDALGYLHTSVGIAYEKWGLLINWFETSLCICVMKFTLTNSLTFHRMEKH